MTTLISAVVATQISGCMTLTSLLFKYNSYKDRPRVATPATIWLGTLVNRTSCLSNSSNVDAVVSTACADILVAIALLWELRSMKTSYTQTKRCSLLNSSISSAARLTLVRKHPSSYYCYGHLHRHGNGTDCHCCLCVHSSRRSNGSMLT
jgi:hypothetical protein